MNFVCKTLAKGVACFSLFPWQAGKNAKKRSALFLFLLLLCSSFLFSEEYAFEEEQRPVREDPIRLELISEDSSIQPGRPFWIALHVELEEHWHAYWKHPGDVGMPMQIEWVMPEGYEISELEWPFPQKLTQNGFVGFGFENNLTLLAQIKPPTTTPLPAMASLAANIRWLVCSQDSCLPGETALSLELPISASQPASNESYTGFFKQARDQLPHTSWIATAKAQNGLVDLLLQTPDDMKLSSAYFCPTEKNMVDSKAEVVLAPALDQPSAYHLLIKGHASGTPSALKGVLVIEANAQLHALEINSPVANEPSMISMTDSQINPFASPNADALPHLPPEPVEFDGGVGLALLFAFMGGFILNLMPCVLPVVSFKVLSFVKMAGKSKSLILKHGLSFSGGVLISFWALAGLMLALQAYGQSVGWGFQLQEPIFVGALAALLLVFSLSLFGVFEMGTSVTAWAGKINAKSDSSALLGSFFSGILATALATPCTGPFLGSAIGFAVTLPTFWALLIFTSLGMGMASPYLLLAAFPSLLRFMPKPGAWMNTFKEILGFVMLATVLWLVWVFAAQTNALSIFMLLAAFFILSIGAWIYGRWGSVANRQRTRLISTILAMGCLLGAGYTISLSVSPALLALEESQADAAHSDWEVFSPERVAELQAAGTPVFVDFTAKWCLICQANHLVLSMDNVQKAMQQMGVVKMKADWTKNDPVITKTLKQFGRSGVPLYVLYGKDSSSQPMIMPQVLTPDIIVDHINQLDPSIAIK